MLTRSFARSFHGHTFFVLHTMVLLLYYCYLLIYTFVVLLLLRGRFWSVSRCVIVISPFMSSFLLPSFLPSFILSFFLFPLWFVFVCDHTEFETLQIKVVNCVCLSLSAFFFLLLINWIITEIVECAHTHTHTHTRTQRKRKRKKRPDTMSTRSTL